MGTFMFGSSCKDLACVAIADINPAEFGFAIPFAYLKKVNFFY
jgi:hypothetical protein